MDIGHLERSMSGSYKGAWAGVGTDGPDIDLPVSPIFPWNNEPILCEFWWPGSGKCSSYFFQPHLWFLPQMLDLLNPFLYPRLPEAKSPVSSLKPSPLFSIRKNHALVLEILIERHIWALLFFWRHEEAESIAQEQVCWENPEGWPWTSQV